MSANHPLSAIVQRIIERLGTHAATAADHPWLAELQDKLGSIATPPANTPQIDHLVRELSREGYLRGAVVMLARALDHPNPSPKLGLRLAQELLDALDIELGIELAQAVLTLPSCQPRSDDLTSPYTLAHILLGQAQLDRGETLAALRHFEAVLALDVRHPLALRGWSACHAQDPTLAQQTGASVRWHDRIEGLDEIALVGNLGSPRYAIGRPLGRGRHAIVFEATDLRLHRPVAIKKLLEIDRPGSAQQRQLERRFFGEAKALAKVRSRHVITLFDAQPEHGFIALEVCRGGSLRQALRRGAVGRPHLEVLGESLAAALRAVHAVGEIHRDVKPANILLRQLEPLPQAVLADFGLVRRVESTGPATAGTLRYLAPEVRAGHNATAASDWYSLGLVLLEIARAPLPLPEGLDRLDGFGELHAHLPDDLDPKWRHRILRLLDPMPQVRQWSS